jgi:hypothetical protein
MALPVKKSGGDSVMSVDTQAQHFFATSLCLTVNRSGRKPPIFKGVSRMDRGKSQGSLNRTIYLTYLLWGAIVARIFEE